MSKSIIIEKAMRQGNTLKRMELEYERLCGINFRESKRELNNSETLFKIILSELLLNGLTISGRSAMVYLSAKEMEKLDVLEGDNDIEKIKILKKVAKEYDIELE